MRVSTRSRGQPVNGPVYAMAGGKGDPSGSSAGQLADWKCRFCYDPADRTTINSGRFKLCLVCGVGKKDCFGGAVGNGKPEPKKPGVVNAKGEVSWGTAQGKGKGKGKGLPRNYTPPGWGYSPHSVWGHGGWEQFPWGWGGKGPNGPKGGGKGPKGGGTGKGGGPPGAGEEAKHIAALQATIKELRAGQNGGESGKSPEGGPVPSGPVPPAKSILALNEELRILEEAQGDPDEIQAKKQEIAKAVLQGRNARIAELRKQIKTLRDMGGDEFNGLADQKQSELERLVEEGREAKPLQTRENELKSAIDRKIKAKEAAAAATEEIRERLRKDNEVLVKSLAAEQLAEKELGELKDKLAETLRKQAQAASPGDVEMGGESEEETQLRAEEALARIQEGKGSPEDFQKVQKGFQARAKKGTGSSSSSGPPKEEGQEAREKREAEEKARAEARNAEAKAEQEKSDRERAEEEEKEKKRAAKVAGILGKLKGKVSEAELRLLQELEEEEDARARSRSARGRGRSSTRRS